MGLSIHLTYSGQCEAAFLFYQRCLVGTFETSLTMIKYGDTPMGVQQPEEWRDKIVHATLKIGEASLAGADFQAKEFEPPRGFFVLLDIDDASDAERVFHSLAENGKISMPMQQTFWARRFGVLVDQFGIPWEINCV